MKRKKISRKTMLLSVILLVVLIGAGVTIALSVASTDPVVNTFQAGKIDTEIKEEFPGDALSKTVTVTNSCLLYTSDAADD